MSARIVADGSDAIVGIVWAVFVVLFIVFVALALVALRRYRANKRTLRSEGLGPVSAAAQRLGEYAERPAGTHDGGPGGGNSPATDGETSGMDSVAGTRDGGASGLDSAAGTRGREAAGVDSAAGPGDVTERLREITELHDRGILDDAEFHRQRGRMLEP